MFKKQAKVFRAGTTVNVSIVSTNGLPISHTSNLTTPAGSVTADYSNRVNVTLDAYSDWGVIRIFPTGSVLIEHQREDAEQQDERPVGDPQKHGGIEL